MGAPALGGDGTCGGDAWVDELDSSAVADAIAAVDRERRLLGARRLLLAVTWADQHVPACQQQCTRNAGERPGAREVVCGCQVSTSSSSWERRLRICRRPGSDGTPAVSASGVAEYAVHSGTTTLSGAQALGEALDLRHRHPRLWRRVMAGEIEEWQARRVTRMSSWLTREEVDRVDVSTAQVVGKLPWGRCQDVVEAAVIAADPEGHEERRREQDERCYVSAGRYRGTDAKGNRTLVARTSASNVARLDALVQHLADLLRAAGDGDTEQVRRAKAIGLLANPAQVCVLLGETVTPDLVSDLEPSPLPHVPSTSPAPPRARQNTDPGGHDPGGHDPGGHDPGGHDPGGRVDPGRDDGRSRAQQDPRLDLDDLGRDQEQEPEQEQDPESEQEPESEPPTAVQLAAEFGRTLSDLAREQGDRSAWDLLRPQTTLVVHLSEDGLVARMSDASGPLGPVGLRQLRDQLCEQLPAWLVDHLDGVHPARSRLVDTEAEQRRRLPLRDQIVVRPVLDVAGQTPVDAYDVPASMREAVVESSVFEVFPWGTAEARRCQLDHTTPYLRRRKGPGPAGGAVDEGRPRGQTRPDNLGPLSAGHHNLKTHLGWRCYQPLPGLYLWQTPSGHWFRIDHAGTTPLGRERPEILRQREGETPRRSRVETMIARVLLDVA